MMGEVGFRLVSHSTPFYQVGRIQAKFTTNPFLARVYEDDNLTKSV